MSSLLEVQDLSYGTGKNILARGLNFSVDANSILFIDGPNGAGKSTLLRVLLGQHPSLRGKVIRHLSSRQISYIPQLQNTSLHLPMTLEDVLRVGMRGSWDPQIALQWGLLDAGQLELAWNSASGGERKRTLLTRALLNDSALLILDEPMNHLDAESKGRIASALEECSASMILVSHEDHHFLTNKKKVEHVHLGGRNA